MGFGHSDVIPKVVDIYIIKNCKHSTPCLVKLIIGTKKTFSEMMKRCPLDMNKLFIWTNLNIFPLGSHDVLIGMDWLEAHIIKIDCYNNKKLLH
jgi:hypothetical protein